MENNVPNMQQDWPGPPQSPHASISGGIMKADNYFVMETNTDRPQPYMGRSAQITP